jgi:hypothetical protein
LTEKTWDALSGFNKGLRLLITLDARLKILSDGAEADDAKEDSCKLTQIGKVFLIFFSPN